MARLTRFAIGLACALALALITAPGANAFVFWANKYDDAIGRAADDAGGADQAFIHGLPPQSEPVGVALRGAHLYWANFGNGDSIGRANLDGSCLKSDFIRGASDPVGVAADGAHVYWTNAATGAIGRANLDGSGANQGFLPGLGQPYGLAVNATHLYWSNVATGAISRADLDGTDPELIATVTTPNALALDGAHLYWADGGTDTIGRSKLDGSDPEPNFIGAPVDAWGVAVDAGHVYWTDQGPPKTVGRADLDGNNPQPSFLPASAQGVYGVAVGPATAPEPCAAAGTQAPAANARDSAAPVLRRLTLSRSRFAAARRGASISRMRSTRLGRVRTTRLGVGTTLHYGLSEAAVVRFTVERRKAGRRVGSSCRKPTRRNRSKRKCDLALKGAFSRRGGQGPNRARFSGRVRGRRLRSGRYKLVAAATDGAGNTSRRAAVRFAIGSR
jgi:hypothetical protein